MDKTISILIKQLVSNPSVSWELKRNIGNALDPEMLAIWWSVGDFEGQAEVYEDRGGAEIGSIYDRSQFRDALSAMVEDHDHEGGISWDTVDVYLEDCRFEK